MQLIPRLCEALTLSTTQAESLAGGLLGGLQERLLADEEPAEAERLLEAVPELQGWRARTAEALEVTDEHTSLEAIAHGRRGDSPAGVGALAAAANELLSKAGVVTDDLDMSFVTALLSGLGLDPTAGTRVAPLLGEFVRERLPEDLAKRLTRAAPFLASGSISGALGNVWNDD